MKKKRMPDGKRPGKPHPASSPGPGEPKECGNFHKQNKACEKYSKNSSICDKVHKADIICEIDNNLLTPCENNHDPLSPELASNREDLAYEKGIRLNRAIASAGAASRRKADELIKAGRVKVNGETALNPATQVASADRIELDNILLDLSPPLVYLMLNKPTHTVTTAHDPQGRKTVLDLLPAEFKNLRLYPVGRLDYFSEGLLLLSNDGELANRLMHPRHHLPKLYEVRIRGGVSAKALAQMESGMLLEDGTRLLPVKAKTRPLADGDSLLVLELRQGVNRQIRRMCDQLGLVILSLKRIAQGPLELGNLKSGELRRLTKKEVDALYRATHP